MKPLELRVPAACRASAGCWRLLGVALFALLTLVPPLLGQTPNPVPFLNQPLVPTAVEPGGPDFTLTVNGTGFVPDSVVNWNGDPRPTTFVSNSQLTATIPATDIAAIGSASVTVVSPSPGGGTSNLAYFHVTNPTSSVVLRRTDTIADVFADVGDFSSAESVISHDFNGDKHLDLAITRLDNGLIPIVLVVLGNGNGMFQPAVAYPTGPGPVRVTAGDFNRDGKVDLAVGFHLGVSILLGNGDGTFQARVDSTNQGIGSIAAADFNGDGGLDLVTTRVRNLSVLLGNGDATFQPGLDMPVEFGPNSPTIGDFDGDGRLDLAATHILLNRLSVLLGNGNGTFGAAAEYGTGSGPISSIATDFNEDGILDLATANRDCEGAICLGGPPSTFSMLLGNGDGSFRGLPDYTAGIAHSLTTGDFNGDGKLDLAAVTHPSADVRVLIALGNGDATFQPPLDFEASPGAVSVVAGDFNGDGRLDLVTANFGYGNLDTVSIFMQAAALTLSPPTITFPDQAVGATSLPETLTLTNTGSAAMTISSVEASGDFAATHTCPLSPDKLEAGAGCTIEVTFMPTATGARSGALTVTSDAVGSPNTVEFSGTGTDFAFGVQSGGSMSATVNAGQAATYNLQIEPSGFSGDAALSCAFQGTQPRGASCSVSPSSVALNGTDPAQFTVSVSSTARALAAPSPFSHRGPLGPWAWHSVPLPSAWVIVLALLLGITLLAAAGTCPGVAGRPASGNSRLEPLATPMSATLSPRVVLPAALLAALAWGACGGERVPQPLQDQGTPAGNYTLILSATANGVSKTTNLGLQVN